jgi:hypothetical protein
MKPRKMTTTGRPAHSAGPTTPALSPDEIEASAVQAIAALPPDDQQAVERAAGEGMVATSVAAATILSRHIEGRGQLLANDGTPVARVKADLSVHAQGWAGRLRLASNSPAARQAARFWLRLDTGGGGRLTVRYRDGADYLVEGAGSFEPAVDWRLPDAVAAPMVATSRKSRNFERSD